MLLYCDHYTMRPNGPSRSTSVLKKKRKRNRPTRREEKRKVVTPVRCVQPCVSLTRARYARRPLGRVVVRYYVSQSYTRPSLSVSVLLLTTSSVCLSCFAFGIFGSVTVGSRTLVTYWRGGSDEIRIYVNQNRR